MALRIPWDKQETAILIDAYIRVKNKELSQQEAVKEVSTLLRHRAILSGMEIDDIFRNENGIKMQMMGIQGLIENTPLGLKNASKLFQEMVKLYKTCPEEFKTILLQAKGECAMQVNVQEKFFTWLSTRVTPAQLSEFFIVCKDIESFCMNQHILVEPLFETTNIVTIQKVIDTIKSDRTFRFQYFRQIGKMCKAMDYYMTFLRNLPSRQTKELKMDPAEFESADSEDVVKKEDNSEAVIIWNFSKENLEFFNKLPVSVSYFGDEVKVQGWADAFVKIICFLQDDYPSIIREMVGYCFPGVEKVALIHKEDIGKLNKAVEVENNLYLETDYSPDEIVTIVRILMDKCNMDYDNLEMIYKVLRDTGGNTETDTFSVAEEKVSSEDLRLKKNRIAFITWAQSQQMTQAAILAYLFDIKKCSEFAQKNAYIKEQILLIEDANVLEQVFLKMGKDSKFVKFNNERRKHPASALNKLIAFRRATSKGKSRTENASVPVVPMEKPVQSTVVPNAGSLDLQMKERYTAILAENFADGFRPEKAIDRNRFKMYYNDKFGEELPEEDEQFVHTLRQIGTFRDGRIFVQDKMEQKDLLQEINDTIMETFKSGASCIYVDCLFARFQEQLAEMLHIYNVDSLESVLLKAEKRNYFKRYNYLYGYNKDPSPKGDVIEYMKNAYLPVTYSKIENDLWYIPLEKIKTVLVTTPEIVNVASETYLYAPNLPVSERELQQIAELISQALLQRSHISDGDLMQLIEQHCPSVLMNTADYPGWGFRNALAYLLRDRFSFRGAVISNKNEEISMAEVFTDFCQRSEQISVDELKTFARELKSVIYWDEVYSEMVRVNQNEFVRRNRIHFNIEKIDAILESLVQDIYVPSHEPPALLVV